MASPGRSNGTQASSMPCGCPWPREKKVMQWEERENKKRENTVPKVFSNMSSRAGLRSVERELSDAVAALQNTELELVELSKSGATQEALAPVQKERSRLLRLVEDKTRAMAAFEDSPPADPPAESHAVSPSLATVVQLLRSSQERQDRFEKCIEQLMTAQQAPSVHTDDPFKRDCVDAFKSIAAWKVSVDRQSDVPEALSSRAPTFGESKASLERRNLFPLVFLPHFLSLGDKAPRETKGPGDRDTVIQVYDAVVRLAWGTMESFRPEASLESCSRARARVLGYPEGIRALCRAQSAGAETLLPDDAFFLALKLVFDVPIGEGGLAGAYNSWKAEALQDTLFRAAVAPSRAITDQALREYRTGQPLDLLGRVPVTKADVNKKFTASSSSSYFSHSGSENLSIPANTCSLT
eukprot:PhM_4_TR7174/c0_g1_i1/m.74376